MHGNVTPTIRRNKPKPPSATAAAAAKAQQYIQDLCSRWELQAVSRGSHDPSAQLQATRILQQLTQYLGQHRSSCKHGSTRALLQKQLPPELLLNLLASGHDDILGATLLVLQDLAHILPVLPVDAAPRLVQLLCCQSHGAAAARVLTAQLAHWRCSQLLPHWMAAGSTDNLFQQLQQLHVLSQTPEASGRNTASRAADACVSMLMLLAKMASLAEQQMLAQLSADAVTASRWLQLLVEVVQQQQSCLAGSHTGLQLQDSCFALLASFSRSPATSQALLASTQLRQSVLQLLHGVLRRPCCVSEADASHIQCWMNAATAASLPAMWHQQQHLPHAPHPGVSTLAPHEEQQLLTDIAIAAAATQCNECFNSGTVAKQVDGAAVLLLAAALLPGAAAYGSQLSCVSQFMGAVLGSSCCHVLLHALACSTTTTAEQAALLAAAAATATASARTGLRPVTPDGAQEISEGDAASTAGLVALVPVQQDVQPAWLLLRMICAQCPVVVAGGEGNGAVGTRSSAAPFGAADLPSPGSGGSGTPRTHVRQQMALLHVASRGGSGPAVQPEQVLRVVQAYSTHITTGSDVHRVPGLLRSMHFLMCQSVLRAASSGRHQQQQEEAALQQPRLQQEQLQWLSLSDGDTSSASSNGDSHEGVQRQLGSGGRQLLSSAGAVLDMISDSDSSDGSADAPATAGGSSPGQGSSSSRPSAHQLSWSLAASVYAALAISVYLQEAVSTSGRPDASAAAATTEAGRLSAADSCLALAAAQLAAAALKLLLPVVVAQAPQGQTTAVAAGAAAAAAPNGQQQRQQPLLVIPLHEALECSLAAVQALATLTSLLQPALPGLLWQSVSNCGSSSGCAAHHHAVKLTPVMVQGCVAAAAAALDAELQQLLAQVVLSWQAVGCSNSPADVSTDGGGHRGNRGASPSPSVPLSVPAALQQHLHQELRCWAAAALVSCYGQLGARTWQGAVLEQFRHRDAPFADMQLQLGPHHKVAGHAAVLAASCPVLRQQLAAAAAAAAATPSAPAGLGHAGSSSQRTDEIQCGGTQGAGGSALVLKLSAAVDPQAFGQALDFIYTGAAVVQCAGLASQLQLCSSCLAPTVAPGSRQVSQQQLAVRQQQQLQELQEQQQSAKQQLHRLGMLARKLQLPLLAALTRSNRPLPGQLLPDLHVSFASLLPRQMLLFAASGGHAAEPSRDVDGAVTGVWCAGDECTQEHQQDREHTHEQEVLVIGGSDDDADVLQQHCQAQQLDACGHSSTAEYLAMLAACTAADSAGAGLQQLFARSAGAAGAGSLAQHASCISTPERGPSSSFTDVLLAAPVLALPCSSTAGCKSTQQQQEHLQPPAAVLQGGGAAAPGEVVYGFFPAHRVLLSGCCPYFEALLSDRWHHDSCQPAGAAAPEYLQQHDGQVPQRVVVVPEADIHVAAALQHYLYTGSLQVQLPSQASISTSSSASEPDTARQGCQKTGGLATTKAGCVGGAGAGQAAAVSLNGCSQGCHQARTLLRLWRCAELLLLPGLQALCVAAVDAAAWQLGVRCCLVLLEDCCQLGVPAAADGLLAALTQRADRDTAAAMLEWDELPSGLQAMLTKAWAERRRLQQEGEDDPGAAAGPHVAPAGAVTGGLGFGPLLVLAPDVLAAPLSSQRATPVLPCANGCNPGAAGQQQGLMLQPPERRAEPVLVGWRHVQALREAGEHLGSVIGTQLPHVKG